MNVMQSFREGWAKNKDRKSYMLLVVMPAWLLSLNGISRLEETWIDPAADPGPGLHALMTIMLIATFGFCLVCRKLPLTSLWHRWEAAFAIVLAVNVGATFDTLKAQVLGPSSRLFLYAFILCFAWGTKALWDRLRDSF